VVVGSFEVELTVPEQAGDDLECLLEPVDLVREGVAKRVVLGFVATCAETKYEATFAQFVKGVGHLGDESRVTETGGDNQRSDRPFRLRPGECKRRLSMVVSGGRSPSSS
jgi:hypothetical protein